MTRPLRIDAHGPRAQSDRARKALEQLRLLRWVLEQRISEIYDAAELPGGSLELLLGDAIENVAEVENWLAEIVFDLDAKREAETTEQEKPGGLAVVAEEDREEN